MRQFLLPNSTISNNIAGGGIVGGNGTAHGVVSDKSMRSYLRSVHSASGTLTRFGMGTYTLTATQRIAAVRIRAIHGQTHSVGILFTINNQAAMGYAVWAAVPFPPTTIPVGGYRLSKWFYKNSATNAEWTQTNLDALEMYLAWLDPSGSHDARVHELDVEAWILEQPVTTNVSPANAAITETNTPRFVWSFFQEDNERSPRQVGFQLKVWTKAVVEGGGFDPDTSASVVNVTKNGVANNYFDLSNSGLTELTYGGQYYWAVKGYNLFTTGANWWSEWSELTPFSVNSPPVTDVTAPTGPVTGTNQPTVFFTYTDPDGLAIQDRRLAKVWLRPGGSWAGFDPDTTLIEPVWEDEEITQDTSFVIEQRLENLGVYRAYVKTAHAVSDHPPYIYGSWDFVEFNINLSQPPTPAITAIDGGPYVGIHVTPAAPSGPTIEHFEIERSLDGGVTWAPFRYGAGGLALSDAFPWNSGLPFSLQDHEVPFGVEVKYRAFGVDTTLGTKVYSAPSTEASVRIRPQAIWLKNPADATMNASFMHEGSWVKVLRAVARATYRAQGRRLPIVVRGKAAGSAVDLQLLIEGDDHHDRLIALVDADMTLYLQSPSFSGYVDIRGDLDEANRLWDDRAGEPHVWRVGLSTIEVEGP